MILFARFAYFTLVRDASLVTLTAALLMLVFSFEPSIAFDIGATVALVFALGLLLRAVCLTEARFTRSEAWSALQDEERPVGERMLLRFAKSAAGIAGILYGSALVLSIA
jgi:hypothetical protein